MASTRKIVTVLLLVVCILAVHATAAQAAGDGASRKLMGAIAGCTSYSGPMTGARRCTACSGGLIPGPAGDRCVKRTTARIGR